MNFLRNCPYNFSYTYAIWNWFGTDFLVADRVYFIGVTEVLTYIIHIYALIEHPVSEFELHTLRVSEKTTLIFLTCQYIV